MSKSLSPFVGLFACKVSYCEVSQSSLAATATHVLIYFRWSVVIFGWHRWHFFYVEPLLILMMCDAFVRCLQNMFAFLGSRESCLSLEPLSHSLIISLLNWEREEENFANLLASVTFGLSLVSPQHALCFCSQMWHSQWPTDMPDGGMRNGGEGLGQLAIANCQSKSHLHLPAAS